MQPDDIRLTRRIERRVVRFIADQRLLGAGETVLLAVSGGPDSLALLHIVSGAASVLDVRPVAAYIDHRLRDAAAIEEERRFVADQAASLGIAFVSARVEAIGGAKQSPEEAARMGRYRALAKLAADVGAASVATGHTRTDQAETVLLRLLRGAGIRGLAAMATTADWPAPPGSAPRLVRPLLTTDRDETVAYCRATGLAPRSDPENVNRRYARNQLRTDVMPILRRFNPRVDVALANLAAEARAWRDSSDAAPSVPATDDIVALNVRDLRAMNAASRTATLRSALASVLPAGRLPGRAHLLSLERLTHGPRGRSITLPAGALAWREADDLLLAAGDRRVRAVVLDDRALAVPGIVEAGEWRVSTRLANSAEATDLSRWQALLDRSLVAELSIGPRRAGDRLELAGMAGRRRLQDLFVDAGVARWRRDGWPVLRAHRGVVWAPGLSRVAVWAAPSGGAAILVSVEPGAIGTAGGPTEGEMPSRRPL